MATVGDVNVRIALEDSDKRTAQSDLLIDPSEVTVSAEFLTAVEGFVNDCTADSNGTKAFAGGLKKIQLVIDIEPASVPTATQGDVGTVWTFGFPSGARRSLAPRSTYGPLTSADSKGELADKTNAAIITLMDRLLNDPSDATTPGLGVRDVNGTNPTRADFTIQARRTRRISPRI